MGFATPEEQWMRENSQDFADLIQSASSQFSEIFHPEGLSETWGAFVNGVTASPLLWRIAMLSIWARTFSVR
jgi:hypothetical protein